MKVKQDRYDVGVIVARFQGAALHQGHRDLLDAVTAAHERVLLFLGNAPTKGTKNNPLPYQARRQMVLAEYPDIETHYINDQFSDSVWSDLLDRMIADNLTPSQTAVLYGSRDSFAARYRGSLPVVEFEPDVWMSGTEERQKIWAGTPEASEAWRRGVVWATSNRFPTPMPTVDVAIFDAAHEKLLLAQKKDELLLRFVGGFVNVGESFEAAARREVAEETTLEVTDPVFLRSVPVDDWRYRDEPDMGIVTSLFAATVVFGRPTPSDDLKGGSLTWVAIKDLQPGMVMETHRPLLDVLAESIAKTPKFR